MSVGTSSFIVWIYDISLIHSPIDGCLGCFQFWATCKESFYEHSYTFLLVNLYVHFPQSIYTVHYGIAESWDKSLVFQDTTNCFPRWLCQFTLSSASYESPSYSTFANTRHLSARSILDFLVRCNGISLYFILHFFDNYWCWAPFYIEFLAIYVKDFFKFFSHFLNWLSLFLSDIYNLR